ncbi:O-antigen ligase family protein [Colwellia sp. D2M02]|uniref:O-antigen ligase family protein n=1 Tax=Colwellia sp. D2M02 TaxID=2841562 RepID=UPI001C0A0F3D|nr:O-antigen ligase family protein [Colwellia sp. D2M02]MBU2895071.1 O-antigen ligase family protein [Colwellia sp. D2M02]
MFSNSIKNINVLLFNCFLLLIFWLPIPLGSNRAWAWGIIEVAAFLMLATYLLLAIKTNENVVNALKPYKLLIVSFLLVQLWVVIQYTPLPSSLVYAISPHLVDVYGAPKNEFQTFSVSPSDSYIASLKGVAYLALMLLSILLVTSEKRLKQLLLVMVCSGTFQAVYGSLQAMSGNELSWIFEVQNSTIATGSFIYKNHFANFLLLCLSMGVGLLVASLSKNKFINKRAQIRELIGSLLKGKAILRIALALMVIGLVMSRSRMGNAAFFIAMSATGIFAFIYYKHRSKGLSILLVSLLVIDTFILGAWFGLDKLKARIEQTALSQESRDEVNIYGLELINDFTITGTGAGTFYTIFPMVKGDDIKLFYDHAHNDYLQFTIEYGFPITMLLAAIVLMSLKQTVYTMRKRQNSLMKGTAFGCMMAIIGMLIHSSVDFNLQSPANASYFVLILTLAWQSRHLLRGQSHHKKAAQLHNY